MNRIGTGEPLAGAGAFVRDVRRGHVLMWRPWLTGVAKPALAAGIAWQLGSLLPADLGRYAYYAALGAITVQYPTVRDSVRQALTATGAVLCGVALAVGMQWLAWPNALTVAAVIGLGTAIGWWRVLGEQRAWVPIAALFVLTAAAPTTETYVFGYITQVPLGAVIGLAVNYIVLPPLPLEPVHRASEGMRGMLVEQLTTVAWLLREEGRPDQQQWEQRLHDLEPARERTRSARRQAVRARSANPRGGRWTHMTGALEQRAVGLERCSRLIEELSLMLFEFQNHESVVLDGELRDRAVTAFEALAELLDRPPDTRHKELRDRVSTAITELDDAIDAQEFDDSESRYIASAIALATRRCARTMDPPAD